MEGHFSRRAFLVSSASVAVGLMAPMALAEPAAALGRAVAGPARQLRRSTYTPLLGSAFRMTDGHTSVPVVLSNIGDLLPTARPEDENRFSLLFSGSYHQPVGQGTYTLVSPKLTVALFVVPVGRATTAQRYLAVVNRL